MKNALLMAFVGLSMLGCSSDSDETVTETPEQNNIYTMVVMKAPNAFFKVNERNYRVCVTPTVEAGDTIKVYDSTLDWNDPNYAVDGNRPRIELRQGTTVVRTIYFTSYVAATDVLENVRLCGANNGTISVVNMTRLADASGVTEFIIE